MKTVFLLMAEHGTALIELEKICHLWGLAEDLAKRRAATNELPVPFFRAGKSQKAKWVCNVEDLAAYLDKQREAAKRNHIGAIDQSW